jgi:hypothetical protein
MKQRLPEITMRHLAVAVAGILVAGAAGLAFSDSDDDHDDDDHHRGRHGTWVKPREDVAPVANAAYAEECGACHMPYQPGLLPTAAWKLIMAPQGLSAHYGDDASLADESRVQIAAYLEANAADLASRSRSRAFAKGGSSEGGLPRITGTRYFRNEHHEIPRRLVADNPEVRSFSRCDACHQGAADGVYNEHRVRIPGHGRWDD